MRKPLFLLAVALFLTLGCAGPQTTVPTLIETGSPQVLDLEVTLLPVLDSRRFLGPEEYPNPRRGVPILIPADKIMAQGEEILRAENLFRAIKPYDGPLPEGPSFRWTKFPLRGLKTDLGLGLELKSLSLRKTLANALFVPHAILDAAALPFFAAAITASNGHTDLAARMIPSASARLTMKVVVKIISLTGGGLVFSKDYTVSLSDPMVTESALFEGFFRSTKDGQALGRTEAPRVIEDVFGLMVRDPELAYLPRYVRTAWLDRALADPRVKPEVKVRLLKGLDRELMLPSFTPEEIKLLSEDKFSLAERVDFVFNLERPTPAEVPGGGFLEAYALDPGWLEEDRARRSLFILNYQVLRRVLGRLSRQKMLCPLSEAEKTLEEKAMALLGLWGRSYAANQLYRADLDDEKINPSEKRVLALLLAQDLETLDNDDFIQAALE
ncbi:MAG: hypothetical protein SV487_10010, partial [Thermodesulfobacteriota bacterium]|nr:hypothetical protein [Thermodesulfobacteriota bacterium]